MHAVDGCDSQKHDKTAGSCDECVFTSDYFLPRDFVESFKHKVKSHAAAKRAERAKRATADSVELDDVPTVSQGEEDDRCGDNWKAAKSKEVFDQTGVFACLCRHGIVEFLIEFVQSAEMQVPFLSY